MNIHLRVQALVEVSSNRRCETTFCGKVIDSIILNIEFDDKFQSIIQPQSEKLFSYHTEDSGKRTMVGDNRKRLQFGRLEANFPLFPPQKNHPQESDLTGSAGKVFFLSDTVINIYETIEVLLGWKVFYLSSWFKELMMFVTAL